MPGRSKSLKVKASEMRPRLSGFSLAGPEFSFPEPGPDERDVARRLIVYLEDKRVLYAPHEIEVPEHCVRSVLDIRRHLTDVIGDLDEGSPMVETVRLMRAACRKFLDSIGDPDAIDGPDYFWLPRGGYGNWVFGSALGELRGVMGVAVAAIAERHGLDIESPLSSILPTAPAEGD